MQSFPSLLQQLRLDGLCRARCHGQQEKSSQSAGWEKRRKPACIEVGEDDWDTVRWRLAVAYMYWELVLVKHEDAKFSGAWKTTSPNRPATNNYYPNMLGTCNESRSPSNNKQPEEPPPTKGALQWCDANLQGIQEWLPTSSVTHNGNTGSGIWHSPRASA